MKNILFILIGMLLSFGILSSCSSDEEDTYKSKAYISGTIRLFDHEELGKYVFIDELKMPKGDTKYNYIETVVVSKAMFPLQHFQTGDAITFKIVEVHSEFPLIRDAMHSYPPSKKYLCSIELY